VQLENSRPRIFGGERLSPSAWSHRSAVGRPGSASAPPRARPSTNRNRVAGATANVMICIGSDKYGDAPAPRKSRPMSTRSGRKGSRTGFGPRAAALINPNSSATVFPNFSLFAGGTLAHVPRVAAARPRAGPTSGRGFCSCDKGGARRGQGRRSGSPAVAAASAPKRHLRAGTTWIIGRNAPRPAAVSCRAAWPVNNPDGPSAMSAFDPAARGLVERFRPLGESNHPAILWAAGPSLMTAEKLGARWRTARAREKKYALARMCCERVEQFLYREARPLGRAPFSTNGSICSPMMSATGMGAPRKPLSAQQQGDLDPQPQPLCRGRPRRGAAGRVVDPRRDEGDALPRAVARLETRHGLGGGPAVAHAPP